MSAELHEMSRNPEVRPYALTVDGYDVPYIEVKRLGDVYHLTLDHRFGFEATEEELLRWGNFLANAMAISAGRTSHGENSYPINRHGWNGAPSLIGEPMEESVES